MTISSRVTDRRSLVDTFLVVVGLLDGDGLDEIYHVIELVLMGFDD